MGKRPAEQDITLIVLAGGEGSRMGRAKGDLRIAGKPILLMLLDRWKWTGPTLLITAPGREHPAGFDQFDREATDPVAGAGPLRGLLTGLENLRTPLAICTAVDMPELGREQLLWISDSLIDNPDVIGCMCHRSVEGKPGVEPFPSAYRKEALEPVRDWLYQGRRSMHALLKIRGFASVEAPQWDSAVWTNINLPDEFERYSTLINATRIR